MLKKSLLLITLALGLSSDLLLTNFVATAKPVPNSSSVRTRPRRSLISRFKVPNVRASKLREPGASRGICAANEITAVLPPQPKTLVKTKIPVELTVNTHPTFFINLPKNTATGAEFFLRTEDKTLLVREEIDLTAKNDGIIAYTLPKSFPGLETGKKYVWRFSLLCDPEDRSGNPATSGWVEKIQPSTTVARQLKAAKTLDELAAIYANNGYWQDTLKALTDLRTANPNDQDILASWNNVLTSVGLKSLAQKPVYELTGQPVEN